MITKSKIYYNLKRIFEIFIDLLYPNRCISCRNIVGTPGFCDVCWKNLEFISKNSCKICGNIINKKNYSLVCSNCNKEKYYFDQNISVFVYNKVIASAIFNFKFREKVFLSKNFAEILKNKINSFSYSIDYITYVPMHKSKLRKRGYNQSFLLAKDLSKLTNIPFLKNTLIKIKNTSPQVGLNNKKRRRNLKDSFFIKDKNIIENKNILIIDDVFTTGSTINECSKILKLNGNVKKVMSLTIAKTDIKNY